MMKYALVGLAMIILASAAFFAGLHWKKYEVQAQLTSAMGSSLVCVANSVTGGVIVASSLDEKDGDGAKVILLADIKSGVAKLKAFGPYLNKNDQAIVEDALQEGETYLSKKNPR